jgi:hypothetical protein
MENTDQQLLRLRCQHAALQQLIESVLTVLGPEALAEVLRLYEAANHGTAASTLTFAQRDETVHVMLEELASQEARLSRLLESAG